MNDFIENITALLTDRFGEDIKVQSVTDDTAGVLSIYVWRAVENRRHVLTVPQSFVDQYESGELLV